MIREVSGSDGMFIVACAADVMRFPFGIVMSIAVCGNNSLWASLGIVCWRKKWPVLPVSAIASVDGAGGPKLELLKLAKLLVGNKSDLDASREVTREKAQQFCQQYGMELLETYLLLNTI